MFLFINSSIVHMCWSTSLHMKSTEFWHMCVFLRIVTHGCNREATVPRAVCAHQSRERLGDGFKSGHFNPQRSPRVLPASPWQLVPIKDRYVYTVYVYSCMHKAPLHDNLTFLCYHETPLYVCFMIVCLYTWSCCFKVHGRIGNQNTRNKCSPRVSWNSE